MKPKYHYWRKISTDDKYRQVGLTVLKLFPMASKLKRFHIKTFGCPPVFTARLLGAIRTRLAEQTLAGKPVDLMVLKYFYGE